MLNKSICHQCNLIRNGNNDDNFNFIWKDSQQVWCVAYNNKYNDKIFGYVPIFLDIEDLPKCPYYLEQLMSSENA